MAFDFKKEYKEFYMPKTKPMIVDIPEMKFIAVRGEGNPNEEGGDYKAAISLLYGIAYTIKMSKKSGYKINGYFDYVIPPLEGFWTQSARNSGSGRPVSCQSDNENLENSQSDNENLGNSQTDNGNLGNSQAGADGQLDYSRKEDFCWTSVIRLPDFVSEEDFHWAVEEAQRKKRQDFSKVEFLTICEGLCVQCMHIGAYDDEPATIEQMDRFLIENGYVNDFSNGRLHHEIYLSDVNRTAVERLKTVIRHPIKKAGE